jgi:hypothetical protein
MEPDGRHRARCLAQLRQFYGKVGIIYGNIPPALMPILAPLKSWVAVWEAAGGKSNNPKTKALLAEAMALTGDLDKAS